MLTQHVLVQLQRPKVCRHNTLFPPFSYPYRLHRIQNLTSNPLKYQPAVNQVELNFWNPQPELLKVGFTAHMRRSRLSPS